MPDILIRMEMPTGCAACDFYNVISGRCTRTGTKINFSELTTRSVDCPISELPPHGDLIDRDEFVKSQCNSCDGSCECVECDCLNCEQSCRCDLIVDAMNAPAVVPAERREG